MFDESIQVLHNGYERKEGKCGTESLLELTAGAHKKCLFLNFTSQGTCIILKSASVQSVHNIYTPEDLWGD